VPCWVEVTVKVSRLGRIFVKVNVTAAGAAALTSTTAAADLVVTLRASHPGVVACVALHVAPEGRLKGTKHAREEDGENAEDHNDDVGTYIGLWSDESVATATDPTPAAALGDALPPALGLVDQTPNGVPLWLGVDSFCEVNYEMEVEMHHTTLEYLGFDRERVGRTSTGGALSVSTQGTGAAAGSQGPADISPSNRHAFFCGRDCNIVYLSLRHLYGDRVLVTTGCPRARADAKVNRIPNFHSVPKPLVGSQVVLGPLLTLAGQGAKWDLLITSGRHGLHPTLSAALIDARVVAACGNFIYTSCNVESLVRDVHVFRHAYHIRCISNFDFFPGTRYVMTMVHLVPRSSPAGVGPERLPRGLQSRRELLVLPFGPPGAGKSTCTRLTKLLFQPAAMADNMPAAPSLNHLFPTVDPNATSQLQVSDACITPTPPDAAPVDHSVMQGVQTGFKRLYRKRGPSATPPLRRLRRMPVRCDCVAWERDAAFAQSKGSGASLKKTKLDLHAQLRAFLRSAADTDAPRANKAPLGVAVLDSSNMSPLQRAQYAAWWSEVEGTLTNGPASRVAIAVQFVTSSHEKGQGEVAPPSPTPALLDALLNRCLTRSGHPAFPTEATEARDKIQRILEAGVLCDDANDGAAADVLPPCAQVGINCLGPDDSATAAAFAAVVFAALYSDVLFQLAAAAPHAVGMFLSPPAGLMTAIRAARAIESII
jgi:hypothetical protein